MLKHNLLLIFRNFKRDKSSFVINLIGLSSGLACALLIFFWVNDELSVDRFFENDRQLFQVMQNTQGPNGTETIDATPGHLAEALSDEIPEVEYAVTVVPTSFNISKGIVSTSDKQIRSVGQYVSEDFFNVFSYKILYGNRNTMLSAQNSVVISRELALKLYGSPENAVGKVVEWNAQEIEGKYTVSGVFDLPDERAINQFDVLLNYKLFEGANPWEGWGSSSPHTYALLKKGTSSGLFNEKIRDFIKSRDKSLNATLVAQRYSDRYLHGRYENGKPAGGRIEYVRLFSVIAIFILIIACINFMNLSTARALGKIKEVGIKKAIGAGRKNLILQRLSESTVMAFAALALALFFVYLLKTPFNNLTGKHLEFSPDAQLVLIVLGITLATGLFAGSYPAFYLSRFAPVDVLKGKPHSSSAGILARKGLVVFQFVASVILIVSVWVVFEQMTFVQSKNLGYNRDHVVYFDVAKMSQATLSEIRNIPGVVNAAGGNMQAGSPLGGTSGINWEGKSPDDQTFFSVKWVGYNLIETLGMKMAAGKAFSEDFGSPDQVVFNETAIKTMGLTDPIGQRVTIEGEEKEIIGVVKDFNFESLYERVKPCVLLAAPVQYAPKVSVRIKAEAGKATLERLGKIYQKSYPGQTFDYKYMDDDYQRLYVAEQRVSALSKYFAGLAILISCLGLFGLAAFTAGQRTKEIGIRKVLGSGVVEITQLLSGDFTRMVIIAIVIALPVSYLIADRWLETFAYRIELEWWYFAAAGLMTLLIAWLTVGMQTVKAALVNPVEALRYE
ncbi:MAG: ABC transporter permease [Prolixibacteraceae bacterium]